MQGWALLVLVAAAVGACVAQDGASVWYTRVGNVLPGRAAHVAEA
jgi:hypothetical protein